jgi:predicted RNase H-like HicB family nuclease
VKDYPIDCFFSEEDGGCVADIPDLDACSAFGASPPEAVAAVLQAREAWLEAARATGRRIPPPRGRPTPHAG